MAKYSVGGTGQRGWETTVCPARFLRGERQRSWDCKRETQRGRDTHTHTDTHQHPSVLECLRQPILLYYEVDANVIAVFAIFYLLNCNYICINLISINSSWNCCFMESSLANPGSQDKTPVPYPGQWSPSQLASRLPFSKFISGCSLFVLSPSETIFHSQNVQYPLPFHGKSSFPFLSPLLCKYFFKLQKPLKYYSHRATNSILPSFLSHWPFLWTSAILLFLF